MFEAAILSPDLIAFVLTISFLAGFAKGVTTMGLNLIGVPLLATFVGVQAAVVSLFLPKAASDLYMLIEAHDRRGPGSSRKIVGFLLAGAAGLGAATFLLVSLANDVLYLILGGSIIIFIALQFLPNPPSIPERQRTLWSTVFGSLTGLSQGLTGVGGPTTAMYLYSQKLSLTAFVYVSSVIYFVLDIWQFTAFLSFGLFDLDRLLGSAVLALPITLGTWTGTKARRRMSVRAFRYALLLILMITAIVLIKKGL